jgi:cytochrome c553
VATGFNRCNVTTSEGGSIEAEFVYRYAVERASTVAQVWLGLTAGCAVCHDHKYDPISAKEFYSLYAFFHSNADPAMDGNSSTTAPFLKLPTAQQSAVREAAAKVERDAQAWLETLAADASYADPADGNESPAKKPIREVLFDEAFPLGAATKSSSRNAIAVVLDPAVKPHSGRRVIRQAFASTLTDTIESKLRPIAAPHSGQLEAWIYAEPLDIPASISLGVAGAGRGVKAVAGKTIKWTRADGQLVREGKSDSTITPGQWTKLVIDLDDLGLKPGDGLTGISLVENGGVCYWDSVVLVGETDPASDPLESLTAWRKVVGTTPPPDLPSDLNEIVKGGAAKKLSDDDAKKLRRFYLALVARPVNEELATARTAWEAARTSRIITDESAPGTFVFRDLEKPRDAFVMLRGQYDKPGEKVEPAIPAILPQIQKDDGRRLNRLDLAKWLVAPENPLTARVTVNRLWQQVFGTGLV